MKTTMSTCENLQKKMMMNKIFLGLVLTVLFSCSCVYQGQEISVYGYEIGDSLTNEFTLLDSSRSIYHRAIYIDDNRFEIALIDKYIYMMNFSGLDSKERAHYEKLISDDLKTKPEFFTGENQFNLKIEGEPLYWIDNKTKTEYMLTSDLKPKTSGYSLFIMNKELSDSLLEINVSDPDVEYEIIYPE